MKHVLSPDKRKADETGLSGSAFMSLLVLSLTPHAVPFSPSVALWTGIISIFQTQKLRVTDAKKHTQSHPSKLLEKLRFESKIPFKIQYVLYPANLSSSDFCYSLASICFGKSKETF
jgi:hypothetical protein